MYVWTVLHVALWKYRTQNIAKNSPSAHHRITSLDCVFATKACIVNRKKNLLNSNISPTCPHNMVNFGALAAEILWWVWGTQQISTGFAPWQHFTAQHSSGGCQPNFAALNRRRHIYSAERPSHWALANILVCLCKIAILICFSFWASVCKTVCPVLSDCCLSVLSCLSVTLVYCGQTVGWHAGRPRPWPHCVRWGPTPSPNGHSLLQFLAHICCG